MLPAEVLLLMVEPLAGEAAGTGGMSFHLHGGSFFGTKGRAFPHIHQLQFGKEFSFSQSNIW
jgi:hypothetical protein